MDPNQFRHVSIGFRSLSPKIKEWWRDTWYPPWSFTRTHNEVYCHQVMTLQAGWPARLASVFQVLGLQAYTTMPCWRYFNKHANNLLFQPQTKPPTGLLQTHNYARGWEVWVLSNTVWASRVNDVAFCTMYKLFKRYRLQESYLKVTKSDPSPTPNNVSSKPCAS